MSRVSRKSRPIFIAFMIISLLQMTQFALAPGIAKINTEVFPTQSLSAIQTAMMLPSLLSTVMSIVSAGLIGRRLLSKKACVVTGISLLALTGVVAIVAHGQFWNLCLLSVLIGSGIGFFVAPSVSIVFDNFSEEETRLAVGLQSSAINFGGIVMSICCGLLATLVWYGGYLMLLLAVPVAVMCVLTLPKDKRAGTTRTDASAHSRQKTSKIPPDTFYFGILLFIFSAIFAVGGTNISSHLAAAEIGGTSTAGIATAAQMAGGVFSGLLFSKLSAKFKDYLLPIAFGIIFVGFTLLNLGGKSLAVNLAGMFIAGMAISLLVPQALFSMSNRVDASNSATAITLVNCVLPGLGTFLSPVVFTNLTMALGGPSTNYRYEFVGVFSLAVGLVLLLMTRARAQREKESAAICQPAD